MINTSKKKLLIFGAGRIGRSLIARIFYDAGYEITFVDSDKRLTDLLNEKRAYRIVVKGNEEQIIEVKDFSALHISETDLVGEKMLEADIAAVAVGNKGFKEVSEQIASALQKRFEQKPQTPLDIILAENLRDSAELMRSYLKSHLQSVFPLDNYAGLVETSIGKMVPIMTAEDLEQDPLQIFAESYNTLILDKNGFINSVPEIDGLAPKDNMKAWVDRKLFIHNLGHAALAYLAHIKNPEWQYTWEALDDKEIKNAVFRAMQESAHILMHMHPGEFNQAELTQHINDLLSRFSNRALNDTIFRVGCEVDRKLSPDDRLVPVIKFAYKNNLPCKNIMKVLISGIYFDARDENNQMHESDLIFSKKFNRNLSLIMTDHCKFDPETENDLIFLGMNMNERIKENLIK